jgi:ABC-type nitrate/sulfonate/bicarbonate transport system substrate-binding protein
MHNGSKHVQKLVLIAALFLSALVLGGCQSQARQPITVQLSWIHDVEFAGFYEAIDGGDYAKAGMDVTLSPGGYDADGNFIDPIEQVASGKAQFGMVSAGLLLQARDGGAPLVAVATIYQRSPIAFVSLAKKNIIRPQDLAGAKVAIDPSSSVVYHALLSSQGIDPESVNLEDRIDFTIAPITSGQVDVLDGWVTNEVVSLQQQDIAYNAILASDYGIEIYPDVIFTTEDMINNQPELVASFLKATIAGDQKAIEDPDGAAELVVKYDPTQELDVVRLKMQASLPLLNPAGSRPGMMTDTAWQITKDILVEQGLLSADLDVSKAYTLDFVQQIYGQ